MLTRITLSCTLFVFSFIQKTPAASSVGAYVGTRSQLSSRKPTADAERFGWDVIV